MADDQLERVDTLPDGIVGCVMIETHPRNGDSSERLEGWGIVDKDEFLLLWSEHKAVWDEVGYAGATITLTNSEIESISHAIGHEPEEVQVALAKFRLMGMVEPICSE